MARPQRTQDGPLVRRTRAPVPHEFVLDALGALDPMTRPMFGCLAVYVGERIVMVLRDRQRSPADNGVWLATSVEHHASLKEEFPMLRSIRVLGAKVTNWQVLPASEECFEEAALRVCALVRSGDPRIGRIPKPKKRPMSRTQRHPAKP